MKCICPEADTERLIRGLKGVPKLSKSDRAHLRKLMARANRPRRSFKTGPITLGLDKKFHGAGKVSITHGFAESEVGEARRRMPEVADCIKDDGRVVYRDSGEVKRFRRLFDQRIDPR